MQYKLVQCSLRILSGEHGVSSNARFQEVLLGRWQTFLGHVARVHDECTLFVLVILGMVPVSPRESHKVDREGVS